MLKEFSESFISNLSDKLGAYFRNNRTFYSYAIVSRSLLPIRLALEEDKTLTAAGEEFFFLAMCYLADLAKESYDKRGFQTAVELSLNETIKLIVSRSRQGQEETYFQDLYEDAQKYLLVRVPSFPFCGPWRYSVSSAVLPAPDYLYLFGTVLMNAGNASGSWPRWPQEKGPGGLREDFAVSKQLLIRDLHCDCDLPLRDSALCSLSEGVVFPPYGWAENEVGDFNLTALFSKISSEKVVSVGMAVTYLQQLLKSQAPEIRAIGVRALLVYGVAPRSEVEAYTYSRVLSAADHDQVAPFLLSCRWRIERGFGTEDEPDSDWLGAVRSQWAAWSIMGQGYAGVHEPALEDQSFCDLEKLEDSEIEATIPVLSDMIVRYPDSWLVKVLYAAQCMRVPEKAGEGERQLRELVSGECPAAEGHIRLGTLLKYQGRHEDAMNVFSDGLKRWPYSDKLVDCCLWLHAHAFVT